MKRQQRMENVRQQNVENMDTNISFLKAIEEAKYLVDPNVRTAAGGRMSNFIDRNANIKIFKEDY
jgi:hypothetical protein